MIRSLEFSLYVFVAAAVLSIFLPLALLRTPVMRPVPVTAIGIVTKVLPSPGAPRREEKRSFWRLQGKSKEMVQDVTGVVRSMAGDLNVHSGEPVYGVVIASFVSGAVAHVLLLVVAVAALLKRYGLASKVSVAACALSIFFMVGVSLANDLLHTSLGEAVGAMENNLLAGLTSMFAQGIQIETGAGLYLLILATFLVFVTGWVLQRQS